VQLRAQARGARTVMSLLRAMEPHETGGEARRRGRSPRDGRGSEKARPEPWAGHAREVRCAGGCIFILPARMARQVAGQHRPRDFPPIHKGERRALYLIHHKHAKLYTPTMRAPLLLGTHSHLLHSSHHSRRSRHDRRFPGIPLIPLDREEEEEEESLFKADAVNEEDSERDRATQV